MRKHGITRISINPQTMNQKTLDLIGRRHTVEDVREKFHLARGLGFDNINMDLIVGLPEETLCDVKNTMEEIKALAPDSVTVHSLAIKRAARLNMFKERYGNLKIENTQEMIDMTARYAEEMGMNPYYLYRQKNTWPEILRMWAMRRPEKNASIISDYGRKADDHDASRRRHHDEGSLSLRKQDREGGEYERSGAVYQPGR